MRIAVLNYSGNVGKTTFARDMLAARLQDHELIAIESVNSDGKEELVIRGEEGDKIYTEILVNEDLILDIGSSNLEAFFREGRKEAEILESIDLYLIPVTPEKKQQFDTLKTVKDLLSLGIQPESIHIVMNQAADDPMQPVSEVFTNILAGAKATHVNFDERNVVYRHDLYSHGQSLCEMLSDTDYREKMRKANESGDKDKAREYATKLVRQNKLHKLASQYEEIFERIMQ